MNFGGEYSAHGLQFGQAARGRRSGIPGWPSAPAPRGPGEVLPPRTLTAPNDRQEAAGSGDHGQVMWVSRAGFPIGPPIGGCHRGTPPQRTPGRKPGSGALIEPTIGLRDANRATRRVPRALAGPSSESPRRRIVNFVRPWSKQAILRSLKAKTRDYLRYREAHARTTDKNVHFSLPRPRKTVCFDRQRPKPTVFRIARPESGGAAPERGRDSRGRRGARAKVVAPGARAVAPRAGARRRARRAYANDTEPSTASSTCWNR